MADQGRRSGVVGGVILIVLGALFMVQQFTGVNVSGPYWPVYIIVPGLLFFVGMIAGGKATAPLAVPGSIVTTVGLILLAQNLTGRYETWAYAWALVAPTAVGAGLVLAGHWAGDGRQVRQGLGLAGVGLALFLAFGSFFELAIYRQAAFAQYLWPLLLIAAGGALLLRDRLRGGPER